MNAPCTRAPGAAPARSAATAAQRVAAADWAGLQAAIDGEGYALLPSLLTPDECRSLAALYDADRFRSRVVMERHGFGKGEYKYFAYPLPEIVADLRMALYPPLAAIANRWNASLRVARRFPDHHRAYLTTCHRAGQTKPTPLLLRYTAGDYNCLHQDVYGEHVFPLQATLLLSAPEDEFTGGEFVLVEQRPRRQSRAVVVPLIRGDAVIFPVHHRPAQGARGVYRVTMRHGVSQVRSGRRITLGLIFHDAR